jgi:hypothetical protein
MARNKEIKLPEDIDSGLKMSLDYAEKGQLISLSQLLNKYSDAEKNKIINQYQIVERVYQSTVKASNKIDNREADGKFWILIISFSALALGFLTSVGAIVFLIFNEKSVPNILISLASTFIGYIGGIVTGILGLKSLTKENKLYK